VQLEMYPHAFKNEGFIHAYKISKTKSVMFWLSLDEEKKIHIIKKLV
jgi:hypothetical protein